MRNIPAGFGLDEYGRDHRDITPPARPSDHIGGGLPCGDRLHDLLSRIDKRHLRRGERFLWRDPTPIGDLSLLWVHLLAGWRSGEEEPRVEPAANLRGGYPTREKHESVQRLRQAGGLERLAERLTLPDQTADALGFALFREAFFRSRQEDSHFLEQLAQSRGSNLVLRARIVGVNAAAWKHPRVRHEIRARRPAHHQHLPRFGAAHQQDGCRRTRSHGRTFVEQRRWGYQCGDRLSLGRTSVAGADGLRPAATLSHPIASQREQ